MQLLYLCSVSNPIIQDEFRLDNYILYFYAWLKAYSDISINNFEIYLNKYSEPASVQLIKQILEPHQLFTTADEVKPSLLSNEHCPSSSTRNQKWLNTKKLISEDANQLIGNSQGIHHQIYTLAQ